jgi:hypothetical protein
LLISAASTKLSTSPFLRRIFFQRTGLSYLLPRSAKKKIRNELREWGGILGPLEGPLHEFVWEMFKCDGRRVHVGGAVFITSIVRGHWRRTEAEEIEEISSSREDSW